MIMKPPRAARWIHPSVVRRSEDVPRDHAVSLLLSLSEQHLSLNKPRRPMSCLKGHGSSSMQCIQASHLINIETFS